MVKIEIVAVEPGVFYAKIKNTMLVSEGKISEEAIGKLIQEYCEDFNIEIEEDSFKPVNIKPIDKLIVRYGNIMQSRGYFSEGSDEQLEAEILSEHYFYKIRRLIEGLPDSPISS